MKQDIRTISNNITELTNNVVIAATSQMRAEGKPVYVSLLEAAPPDMSAYDIHYHIQTILEELSSRPEINDISFPQTGEEKCVAEQIGPLSLMIGCNRAYCKNLFDQGRETEQGYIEPKRELSIARKAELVENAIAYVQDESHDPIQDLTERVGFSMEELGELDLFSKMYQPNQLTFVMETKDPFTNDAVFTSYKTIEQAMASWDNEHSLRLYGETEFGSICLVHPQDDTGRTVCLPLQTGLLEVGLLNEDLPEELIEKLNVALDLLSIHFPKEIGLPSKLNRENAIGQTMYCSQHCFYGEILNMEPVLCTGFRTGEQEHLDQIRVERETEDKRGNSHTLKHVLLRSQILLNKEDVLSEAAASRNLPADSDQLPILAVSKNIQTGHIFMLPLEREEDPYDGTTKLRRWNQEYSLNGRAPTAGESMTKDGYQVFFFDITDLDRAIDKTIELMRPYVSEVQLGPGHFEKRLAEAIQTANIRAAGVCAAPAPMSKESVHS